MRDRPISMLPLGPPLDDFQLRLQGKISAEEYVRRLDERVRQRREEAARRAVASPRKAERP
jgi:hypothetical protein